MTISIAIAVSTGCVLMVVPYMFAMSVLVEYERETA